MALGWALRCSGYNSFLLSFFSLELEICFLPYTNVPHVVAGPTDSTPAGEHLIQGKKNPSTAEPQTLV